MTKDEVYQLIKREFSIVMPTHSGWMIQGFNPLRKYYHIDRMEKLIKEHNLPIEIDEGTLYNAKFTIKYITMPNAIETAKKFVEQNPAFYYNKELWIAKISEVIIDYSKQLLAEMNPIMEIQKATA